MRPNQGFHFRVFEALPSSSPLIAHRAHRAIDPIDSRRGHPVSLLLLDGVEEKLGCPKVWKFINSLKRFVILLDCGNLA